MLLPPGGVSEVVWRGVVAWWCCVVWRGVGCMAVVMGWDAHFINRRLPSGCWRFCWRVWYLQIGIVVCVVVWG